MNTYSLPLLVAYNQGANEKMNALIQTLTADQWNKNLGGFFPSVHALNSHLQVSDHNWLVRYKALRRFTALGDPIFDKPYSFQETLFADIPEYIAARAELDKRIIAFIEELTQADLDAVLTYTDSRGTVLKKKMAGVLIHQFNHGTHHRGMASVYLEMLGKPNDYNGVSSFV
ncbi:MAG: DinB family protein [Spirochaetaceae bacterium]|jgi:uncharacterized damage-inducible protein DinB|nr:DinB family protein [Spirochaetaceae bacterium]